MGGVQFGSISYGDQMAENAGDLELTVQAGALTQAYVDLLTREKQMFGVVSETIDESGVVVQNAVGEALTLNLVDARGQDIAQMESLLGIVTVEALSGEYRLRMNEKDAQRLGVQPVSAAFDLPSQQDVICFPGEQTRLRLFAVNERGEVAPGAAYQLTDSVGERYEVLCDEDGMAVTPLLAPGEVTIETLDAPAGHAPAQATVAQAVFSEAAQVQILHESLGVAVIHVSKKSLDEHGEAQYAPVQGRAFACIALTAMVI